MKIAIMGSGGVGGYYGGRLAKAGEEVTFIARGPHLAALRGKGLRVKSHFGDFDLPSVNATDDSAEVGPVELVIVAVKAYGLDAAAEAMLPLMGETTTVLPLLNGVDIGERLDAVLGADRVMPGLCMLSSFIAEPGVIHQVTPFEYIKFGETSGKASERGRAIETTMKGAEINAELSADITVELWDKFLFLTAVAGLCAVSRSPLGLVRSDPDLRAMLAGQIGETEALGRAKGVNLAPDAAERILAQLDGVPAEAKPSMLMDLEAGRPLELEVLQGTLIKMGAELGIETPVARFIYAALKLHVEGA
ncbi:MAG: 2-dehydropantoate 2-reductase [bacterium]